MADLRLAFVVLPSRIEWHLLLLRAHAHDLQLCTLLYGRIFPRRHLAKNKLNSLPAGVFDRMSALKVLYVLRQ